MRPQVEQLRPQESWLHTFKQQQKKDVIFFSLSGIDKILKGALYLTLGVPLTQTTGFKKNWADLSGHKPKQTEKPLRHLSAFCLDNKV